MGARFDCEVVWAGKGELTDSLERDYAAMNGEGWDLIWVPTSPMTTPFYQVAAWAQPDPEQYVSTEMARKPRRYVRGSVSGEGVFNGRSCTAFEFEWLDVRDQTNIGLSVTDRPNQNVVDGDRKSALDRQTDVFLRNHGVKGLRIAAERQHDRTRGSSILSDGAKAEIVAAYFSGETQTSIAKRFSVSRRLVFNVLKGEGTNEVMADLDRYHKRKAG